MKRLLGIALAFAASLAMAQNINIGTKNTTYKDTGVAEFKNSTLCFREGTGTDKACIAAQIMSGDQVITIPAVTGTLATLDGSEVLTNKTINGSQLVANSVALGKIAQIATARFLGRTSASTGDVEELTATQSTAMLNSMTGDAGSGGLKGLVPAQATGDATKTLSGAGTWITAAGTPGGSTTNIQYNNSGAFGGFGAWNGTAMSISSASPISGSILTINKDTTWPSDVTNAALMLAGASSPTHRLVLGMDSNVDAGFIAAGVSGPTWKPLNLNPSGGNVSIGSLTGSLTIDPTLLVNGTSSGGIVSAWIKNTSSATGSKSRVEIQNDEGQSNLFYLEKQSSLTVGSDLDTQARLARISNSHGMTLGVGASSNLYFQAGSTGGEMGRWNATNLTVGTNATPVANFDITNTRANFFGATSTSGNDLYASKTTNGQVAGVMENKSNGTGAYTGWLAVNDAGSNAPLFKTGSGYTTAGLIVAGQTYMMSSAGSVLFGTSGASPIIFAVAGTAAANEAFRILGAAGSGSVAGNIGIGAAGGVTNPTAYLHIKAGTATAGTGPIKIGSGTNLSTAEAGMLGEFDGTFRQTRASAIRYAQGGRLTQAFADVGTPASNVETDLHTYTTPASTLSVNGDSLHAIYAGTFAGALTVTPEFRVYFGGTAVFDSASITFAATESWKITTDCIRVSSSIVRCSTGLQTDGATGATTTAYTAVTGLTLTNTNIIKLTGQSNGSGQALNDTVLKLATVDTQPAN